MSDGGAKEEGISGSLKVLENEGDEGIEAWLWRPARRKGNTL